MTYCFCLLFSQQIQDQRQRRLNSANRAARLVSNESKQQQKHLPLNYN